MSGSVRRFAVGLVAVGVALSGCADHGAPATAWENEPDGSVIDGALDTPAAQRLVGSFLRSSGTPNDGGAAAFRRDGGPVTVYAIDPSFRADPGRTLERAGIESYIAVPVRAAGRSAADTVQLAPSPPYLPRAVATGVEETSEPRAAEARLLLDYPTHTWFAWTQTRVTVISSGTTPALTGKEFDAEGFRSWLRTR
ncbi:hypothetical protein ACIA8C_28890 [Nocardia sp. NPDC051321]|uniref:hypothetical protein n=1 Tax=Nocardia sp. NPDC051321 TaxID=3364323 RepID=UPI00378BF0C4